MPKLVSGPREPHSEADNLSNLLIYHDFIPSWQQETVHRSELQRLDFFCFSALPLYKIGPLLIGRLSAVAAQRSPDIRTKIIGGRYGTQNYLEFADRSSH
jgi:hypothetical protein